MKRRLFAALAAHRAGDILVVTMAAGPFPARSPRHINELATRGPKSTSVDRIHAAPEHRQSTALARATLGETARKRHWCRRWCRFHLTPSRMTVII
jgi:hypothetical protein